MAGVVIPVAHDMQTCRHTKHIAPNLQPSIPMIVAVRHNQRIETVGIGHLRNKTFMVAPDDPHHILQGNRPCRVFGVPLPAVKFHLLGIIVFFYQIRIGRLRIPLLTPEHSHATNQKNEYSCTHRQIPFIIFKSFVYGRMLTSA